MLLLRIVTLASLTTALIHTSIFVGNKTSKTSSNALLSVESTQPSFPEVRNTPSSTFAATGTRLGSYIHQGLSPWPATSETITGQTSSPPVPSSGAVNGLQRTSTLNTTRLNASRPSRPPNLDANKSLSDGISGSPSTAPANRTSAVSVTSAMPRPASLSTNSTNGTGFQAALNCWYQWNAYSDSTSSTVCFSSASTTIVETVSFPRILYDTYTLCDGVPRAVVSNSTHPYVYETVTFSETDWFEYTATESSEVSLTGIPTRTIGSTVLSTLVYPESSSYSCGTLPTPITTPTCSIQSQYCSRVWDVYDTMVSKKNAGSGSGSAVLNTPPCSWSDPVTGQRCNSQCAVYVATVQLIYFPVSMTGDFCGNYYTVTPNVSTLVTEVALGTTFTSGTAYISYSGASAGGPGGTCGQVHSSGIFAVPSSRVSSYFYRAPGPTVTDEAEFASLASFNFADLAPNPLPAAAWSAQASCVDNLGETPVDCATITEANYAPEINVLPLFKSLDPAWSNCQFHGGVVDPPYALSQGLFAAAPAPNPMTPLTESYSAPTAPATPGSGPPPAYPSQTASPQTVDDPVPGQGVGYSSSSPLPPTSPSRSSRDPHGSDSPPRYPTPPNTPAKPNDPPASNDPVASNGPPQVSSALGNGLSSQSLAPLPNDPASKVIGGILGSPPHSIALGTPAKSAPNNLASHVISILGGSAASGPSFLKPSSPPQASPNKKDPPAAQTAEPITKIAGQSVAKGGSGIAIIGEHTIHPGEATTIDGTPVSLGSQGLVIPTAARDGPPSDPDVKDGGPNGDGSPSGDGSSQDGAVGNTAKDPYDATHAGAGGRNAIFTIGSQVLTGVEQPGPSGTPILVAGSLTLTEGGPVSTISGMVLRAASNGLTVGDRTVLFSSSLKDDSAGGQSAEPTRGAVLTIGSSTITAVEQTVPGGEHIAVLGSSTLRVGGPAQTHGDEIISAMASGIEIISGGHTSTLLFSPIHSITSANAMATEAIVAVGSSVITASEESGYAGGSSIVVIDSRTLTIGGAPITTDGETISAIQSGLVIISNGYTKTIPFTTTQHPFSDLESPTPASATEAVLTLGSSIVTATEEGGISGSPAIVLIDGQTLTVGGTAITIDGEAISAGSSGLVIVSGGSTITDSYSTVPIRGATTQDPNPSDTGGSTVRSATTTAGASSKHDKFFRLGLIGHCVGVLLVCVIGLVL